MPTPAERKALVFVAALAALGVAARGYRAARVTEPAAGARAALDNQISAVDSAVAAARSSKGARASRNRGRAKGDGSPALPPPSRPAAPDAPPEAPPATTGLDRAEERRLAVERSNAAARARVAARTAELLQGRVAQPAPAPRAPSGAAPRVETHGPVDLDTAPASDIATVPGIGPTLARRIVAERAERGAFGSLVGLQRVRGIGPAMAAKISRFVTFSRPLSSPSTVTRFRPLRPRTHRP